MKKYKAYALVSYDLICDFELEDHDENNLDPLTYAKYHLDGGDFTEIKDSDDWRVYDVEEII